MSTEENKAITRRSVEGVQSRGNIGALDEFPADSSCVHRFPPGLPPDRERVKQLFTMRREAFPDFRAVIHDQMAKGDTVVTRKTVHSRPEGEVLGILAAGKELTFEFIDILRLVDRRITDHWNVVDQLDQMHQLSVMPR